LHGQNPLHGTQREGAVADGTLQGVLEVGRAIRGQQGQHLFSLLPAIALTLQQAFQEALSRTPIDDIT
jgi:hypothetical protein